MKPFPFTALLCSAVALAAVNFSAVGAENEAAPAPAPVPATEKKEDRSEASQPNAGAPAAEKSAATNAVPDAASSKAAPTVPAPAAATNEKAAAAVAKTATNAPAPLTLESFQTIADKNIFNQSRVPRVAGRPAPSTNEVKRVPKVDAFALVGTMSYTKGDFAFFDGSNSDYRKTLKAGDKIAGHQVKAVAPSHVTLEWEGNALDVKVGQQLRREDDGPWQVSNRTETFASSGSGGSSGSSPGGGASSATSAPASGSRSEALQRLLEQRRQKQ